MPSQPEILIFGVGLLVFWLLVNLLHKALSLENYGLKLTWVFIKYESQRFKALIEKMSEGRRGVWRAFSNLSLALGVGLMVFSIYFLSENLLKMELGEKRVRHLKDTERLFTVVNNALRKARGMAQSQGPLIFVKIDKGYYGAAN